MSSTCTTIVSALLLVAASTTAMAQPRWAPPPAVEVSSEISDDNGAAFWSALLEPSYLPFNRSMGMRNLLAGPSQMTGVAVGFDIAAVAPIASTARSRARSYRHTTSDRARGSTGAEEEKTVMSVTYSALFRIGYKTAW
jgi:hypothetical protein